MRRHDGWGCNEKRNIRGAEEKINHRYSKPNGKYINQQGITLYIIFHLLVPAEMIVGPASAYFMDEISNGLDSSTTFQIINCFQQLTNISEYTMVISLLQPTPEVFDLFDDLILMAEGKIIYHGPRYEALNFFEECGFICPERKAAADFLQEVIVLNHKNNCSN